MANIILPLAYYFLTLGRTVDFRDYESMVNHHVKRIYDLKQDDILETPVNALTSKYYVITGNSPYSKLGVPIDLILMNKDGRIVRQLLDPALTSWSGNSDTAVVVIVTEYIKIEQSIKENATLAPRWQNVPKSHTHYVDKRHYGGRCVSQFRVHSNVTGDIQIIKRILREVMGESGSVGEDTIDLWRKAVKTLKESKDVRGEVVIGHNVWPSFADLPSDAYISVEKLLKYLNDFPKYVKIRDLHGPLVQEPIYVTFKPLHELDERYPSVEKNAQAEKYMLKLQEMDSDLKSAKNNLQDLDGILSLYADFTKVNAFFRKLRHVQSAVGPLTGSDVSMYRDINETKFKNAFEKYQEGLDSSVENYVMDVKRLKEEIGVTCTNGFLTPTRGSLIVESNEVVEKGKTDLAECQDSCFKDERCRAIGYEEKEGRCVIYYRSTRSAKILFPQSSSMDSKVYDRKCH